MIRICPNIIYAAEINTMHNQKQFFLFHLIGYSSSLTESRAGVQVGTEAKNMEEHCSSATSLAHAYLALFYSPW